jgi:mono/diheme cytochrome c family protein
VGNEGLNSVDTVEVAERSPQDAATPSRVQAIAVPMLMIALLLAIIVAIAWLMLPQETPYTKSVLGLAGDPTKGRSIFVMNCAACHGQWADGKVGPSLHGVSDRLSKADLIHQVVSGETPPMPQFQPEPQEMADLLKYLQKL